ncbi:hypothetical protein MMC13_005971 [Lambiella insularis]|nr:hypothetical protein [Lambiella insularis]
MPTSSVVSNKPKGRQTTELDNLNAHLKHISEKVIAQSPYLLTVPPCGEAFRLTKSQANDWTKNTPFHPGEAELQYLSFLDRSQGETIIKVVGGWDNGKGELVDASPNGTQAGKSGTTTPKQGGKKMTLADYKNKKASGLLAAKDVSNPNELKPLPPPINGAESEVAKTSSAMPVQEQSKKRSIDNVDTPAPATITLQDNHHEPPQKKPRITPPQPASLVSKDPPQSQPTFKIPSLLSPTLPPVIETILARQNKVSTSKANKPDLKAPPSAQDVPKQHQSSSQSSSSRDGKEGKTIKQELKIKAENRAHKAASVSVHNVKSSNKTVPSAQRSHEPSTAATKNTQSRSPAPNGIHSKQAASGASAGARDGHGNATALAHVLKDDTPDKHLIVRLKIPKSLRKDVIRLLQTKPAKPQSKPSSSIKAEEKQTTVKQDTSDKHQISRGEKVHAARPPDPRATFGQHKMNIRREEVRVPASASTKPKEKRARTEEDAESSAPQSKRQKQPNSLDLSQKPSTPIPPPFKSPSISTHGSAHKIADSKSGSSRKLEVGDAEIKTPQGSVQGGTPLAPNSVDKSNRDGRSASNTSSTVSSLSGNSEELTAWKAEAKKYQNLGRALKHEGDEYKVRLSEKDEPRIEKKMIAVSIESVLSFMLAYIILDEVAAPGKSSRKAVDVKTWETIFGFLGNTVQQRCQGHTLIHGLCLQLEAVCRNLIANADIERSAPNQALVRISEDASTKPLSETSQNVDYTKQKAKMAENYVIAQKRWIEGAFELSIDDLQQSFPASWKLKSRAPLARTKEKLKLGSLNGDFYLPLSNITTGIEAVRAGWSLLGEWCKKENVEWTGKLGL